MSNNAEEQTKQRHTGPEITFRNEVRTARRNDRGIQNAMKRTDRRAGRKSRSAWMAMFEMEL